ncbi:glycosyltransferase [candidate division KSB1 bacterium]|nr:glycosyltransferase [candidate division KSB1 bacterium]
MKARKLRVLHLVNGFAIGGGETGLLTLVKLLNRDKFDQIICAVGQGGPLRKDFEATGFPVRVFPKKRSFDFSLISKVVRLMESEEIDIVLTTLFYADVIGALAAKRAHVPAVISWEVVTHPFKFRHTFAYKRALKHIDMVVPVSHAIGKQIMRERGVPQEKIHTIHYGVDTVKYQPHDGAAKRRELGIDDQTVIFGTNARMTLQKGHTYLIDAAKTVVQKYPHVKFVLAGDGPLRGDIEQQIQKNGLTQNFQLLGFRTDIAALLGAYNLYVLPSLYEGLPNQVLEAMACGKGVVATAVDGTVEAVVDGTTGLLVPPKDAPALANTLLKVLDQPESSTRFGVASRQRIEENFTIEKEVRAFENLFTELYARKNGRVLQSR